MSTTEPDKKAKLDAFNLSDLVGPNGPLRLAIHATFKPIGGLNRFQPTGFPEIGHVIYKAPQNDGTIESVCIIDSPASMANHLEAVCRPAQHDPDAVPELAGMPYLRCVTDAGWPDHKNEENTKKPKQVVVTSLTEGHRIASTYFLGVRNKRTQKWDGKGGQRLENGTLKSISFGDELVTEMGVVLLESNKGYLPPDSWWTVFSTIFKYDPNALVHGVLFPQWQIKIPRVLTAHLEAFGAARVDRSGVKFDRLGKTTSGQPIFAVDDATAHEIRATFILDLALLRSFGRDDKKPVEKTETRGLSGKQKEFVLALALWKIGRLLGGPFRYRSGCDLECDDARVDEKDVTGALAAVNITSAIKNAGFKSSTTHIYWSADELYREGGDEKKDGESEDEDVENREDDADSQG